MHCSETGPMTCKINLLFLPYHNTGGHFIDWSIQYVCGKIEHESDQFNKKNWHHHASIITHGFDDTVEKICELKNNSKNKFENIYVNLIAFQNSLEKIYGPGITIENSTHQQRTAAINYSHDDFKELYHWAQNQKIVPVIFDYCEPDLLSIMYNNRHTTDLYQILRDSQKDVCEQYVDFFFKDSKEKFTDKQLWDQREMLALVYRFDILKIPNLPETFVNSLPHLYYNTDDVWNNFAPVLQEICLVLGLEIDPGKFPIWCNIYKEWRNVHDSAFGRHLDRIIDAIVNNKFMALDRFNLNFFKEVIIQNQLILKHNLNLKTWNLEKFPNNTQDLYKLLEPNIHTI